jgi:hypothetical protein
MGGTMALTIDLIRHAASDKALLDLLSVQARRLLPDELFADTDRYYSSLDAIPRGIRAMAGIYSFCVSMSMDDLAWHFTNHNDERHIRETLDGLRELELPEIADLFQAAWKIMRPYMADLSPGLYKDQPFHKWAKASGVQEQIDPANRIIWAKCKELGPWRLQTSWALYARKYPERCVVAEAKS